MKFKKHKFIIEGLPRGWRSDGRKYSCRLGYNNGGRTAFFKHATGKISIEFESDYADFFSINTLNIDEIPDREDGLELTILWDSIRFEISLNGVAVATFEDKTLAEAASLGVCLQYYRTLSSKNRYLLKKSVVVDEGDVAWELDEVPNYVVNKYGLTPENIGDFLRTPSNGTQGDREVMAAWNYATLLKETLNGNPFISLVKPGVDRGVDVIIRIMSKDNPRVRTIDLQICEVPLLETDKFETAFVQAVVKSKLKGIKNSSTLLCSAVGLGKHEIDCPRLREIVIGEGEWPFFRVVMSIRNPQIVFTLASSDQQHFFMIRRDGGVIDVYGGRTAEEMLDEKQFDPSNPKRIPM